MTVQLIATSITNQPTQAKGQGKHKKKQWKSSGI